MVELGLVQVSGEYPLFSEYNVVLEHINIHMYVLNHKYIFRVLISSLLLVYYISLYL